MWQYILLFITVIIFFYVYKTYTFEELAWNAMCLYTRLEHFFSPKPEKKEFATRNDDTAPEYVDPYWIHKKDGSVKITDTHEPPETHDPVEDPFMCVEYTDESGKTFPLCFSDPINLCIRGNKIDGTVLKWYMKKVHDHDILGKYTISGIYHTGDMAEITDEFTL